MKTNLRRLIMICTLSISTFHAGAQSWLINGNTGTISGTHFIGTTDYSSLDFRTNNKMWMSMTPDGYIDINSFSLDTPATLTVTGYTHMVGEGSIGNGRFIIDKTAYLRFNSPDANSEAMIYMFSNGSSNLDRMVLAHSSSYPTWGLEYQDNGDKFHFRSSSARKVTVNLYNGRVGLGKESPAYQLHLSTNSAAKPSSSTWTVASDQRLKKDISEFTDGLDIIEQIRPVRFRYTGEAGLPGDQEGIGTIAQELQKVAPYMVNEWTYKNEETGEETNYLDADYHALFFLFINAFKEQQKQIDELQRNILELKSGHMPQMAIDPDASEQSAILGQNIPNPFDQSTIIPFRLPKNCTEASIVISESSTGRVIKTIPLACDETHLMIQPGTLASGTYSYSLYVDGIIADSRLMMTTK